MLDLRSVDLDLVIEALEDDSPDTSHWLDPETGEVHYCGPDDDPGPFDEQDFVRIRPMPAALGHDDAVMFIATVEDEALRAELTEAVDGATSLRRFTQILARHDDLRSRWRREQERAARRHAVEWLVSEDIVDARSARSELA